MTIPEYIQAEDMTPFHYRDRFCADINIKRFAYRVADKARKDELRKINEILNNKTLDNDEKINSIIEYVSDSLL